ncbi:MMPL family transporter [Neobacillus sp. MER 74]|uniref:MMPL family transporter n=2 Tax=Bacillaceae TaxID=186817 RepID=UPI00203EDEFB|nr:MMPL family transporter [Neobacillus sp. MER 74]MCM3118492.1 MMPL family transporter [Neobacillus sp. MER 74]
MREINKKGLFWHWGIKMYKFRWAIAIFWILLFILSAFFAQRLPDRLNDSGLNPRGSESDIGVSLMKKELRSSPSTITIVYTSRKLDLTSEKAMRDIIESLDKLKKQKYVEKIQINKTPRLIVDKGIQSVVVELKLNNEEALNNFPEMKRLIRKPQGMDTYVDGEIATIHEVQLATKHDMAKSEKIGLPIALIVLLFIFGTLWAAILPLLVGLMSVSLTMGITYYLTGYYSLSNFLPNIVMMLGLAIGVDYALFLVSRFREELKRQQSVGDAVAMATQTAGQSVIFSGFAVLIGMFGMLFIKLPIIYSLCLGGVLVVFSAMILSCTLLPSLLGIFGHHINSLQVFPGTQKKLENSIMWERIANSVMKKPAILAILISTLLISLMLPIFRMKVGVPTTEVLPPAYESRKGADLLKGNYDVRKSSPLYIIVKAKENVTEVASIRKIKKLEEKIRQIHGVLEVQSYIDILGNRTPEETSHLLELKGTHDRMQNENLLRGNFALLTVVPRSKPDSAESSDLVNRIRNKSMSQLETYVTGQTALRVDLIDRINSGLPLMMLFIIIVTYSILLSAFKSVLIPLKAVIMNVLSLGASLGIVVIVFQYGWLADFLNITSTGYVSVIMPVTIFCIVFGISMDYEVFLISRIKEEYDKLGDNVKSTAIGLQKTGRLISSAALILLVVVGSFIFTNIEITKALGVGLFCAIFIDATLIRIILVPALMKLLGPANWWAPRWIIGK